MMTSKTNVKGIKTLLFSFLFILVLVLLISGCSEKAERIQKPISQKTVQIPADSTEVTVTVDPCVGIICGENEACSEGECICAEGYNICGDSCISNESCCNDKDCSIGYFCNDDQECENGCDDSLCESNKICDDLTLECACESGYKWCENQRKCILKESCCTNYDCVSRDCITTISFVSLCIESEGRTGCEKIPDAEQKTFYVNNQKYNVFVKKITEDNIILFLNNEGIDFSVKDGYQIDSDTFMYAKVIKIFGGECNP